MQERICSYIANKQYMAQHSEAVTSIHTRYASMRGTDLAKGGAELGTSGKVHTDVYSSIFHTDKVCTHNYTTHSSIWQNIKYYVIYSI